MSEDAAFGYRTTTLSRVDTARGCNRTEIRRAVGDQATPASVATQRPVHAITRFIIPTFDRNAIIVRPPPWPMSSPPRWASYGFRRCSRTEKAEIRSPSAEVSNCRCVNRFSINCFLEQGIWTRSKDPPFGDRKRPSSPSFPRCRFALVFIRLGLLRVSGLANDAVVNPGESPVLIQTEAPAFYGLFLLTRVKKTHFFPTSNSATIGLGGQDCPPNVVNRQLFDSHFRRMHRVRRIGSWADFNVNRNNRRFFAELFSFSTP